MLGVIIAQLMRLSHSTMPNPVLGFFVVSIPLSGLCLSMSLLILFIGFYRFIHGQKEMTRGHAVSGGWEMFVVASLSVLVSCHACRRTDSNSRADFDRHVCSDLDYQCRTSQKGNRLTCSAKR